MTPQLARLTIRDDGCGFRLTQLHAQKPRGLAMLQDHISQLQGQLTIDSQPDAGTIMWVKIPIGAKNE